MSTKIYNYKISEKKWKKFWEKNKTFSFNPKSKGKIFAIDTPPPTISGDIHMGHAFSYTHGDIIARFKRMNGFNVFYPFGFDNNGLPTERLVEREENTKATKMPRKQFNDLCLQVSKKYERKFKDFWETLGLSVDWNLLYTTIDQNVQKLSQKSFIDLYEKGREYRKEAPTIWCPECQTAIAQVELEDKELSSTFNDILFEVEGKHITIATTRPELLPSCVAVFIHPDDERYKILVGKEAKVPLFNYKVPIIADDKVDREKGTGIVMCCTFGDIVDIDWFYKHNLPLKISIRTDGFMDKIAQKYEGLPIKEAREKIIQDLKENNLLTSQKHIKHTVNVHERCGTEIEFLVTKQWFIKYLDLKKQFLEQGKKLNWYPKHMKVRYDNWVKGLQWDWLISRQRYFGVPFPLWYCKNCKGVILAEDSQLPVDPLKENPKNPCEKCKSKGFIPEKDIMDTWATSSLTPQIVASLMPKAYNKIYPMTLRPQAHDIITFWLFNTVVKSYLHNKKLPWKDVMISGHGLDPQGKKMSKSKGNLIDPVGLLEKYPADAIRFWAAGSRLGDDLPYQEKDVHTGQRTITKLWNASRFTFLQLKDYKNKKPKKLEPIDKWILVKLNKIIGVSTQELERYEYSKVKSEVENFFWNTFCANYLEISKDRLYNPQKRGKEAKLSAQYTLYHSILSILKLFAPLMPFITEEIYQQHYKNKEKHKSIHISSWPKADKKLIDKKTEDLGNRFVEIVENVRQHKSQNKKSLKTEIKLTLDKKDYNMLKPTLEDLKAVTSAREIKQGKFSIEF